MNRILITAGMWPRGIWLGDGASRTYVIATLLLCPILLLTGIASAGTSYIHANGQLIAKINETGNITYYHPDHLGSTSVLTNEVGEVIEEQVNLPFGEILAGDERYGFTSKELDETGLQYFGARYYSPLTGQFLTVDPVKDGMNWYAYGNNNPLKYVDPDGTSNLPAPVPKSGLPVIFNKLSKLTSPWNFAAYLGSRGTPYESTTVWGLLKNYIRYYSEPPEETIIPAYDKETRRFTTYIGPGTSNEIPPSFTKKEAKLLERIMNLDPVKNPSGIEVRKGEVTFEMLEYLAGNPEGIEYALCRAKRKWHQLWGNLYIKKGEAGSVTILKSSSERIHTQPGDRIPSYEDLWIAEPGDVEMVIAPNGFRFYDTQFFNLPDSIDGFLEFCREGTPEYEALTKRRKDVVKKINKIRKNIGMQKIK